MSASSRSGWRPAFGTAYRDWPVPWRNHCRIGVSGPQSPSWSGGQTVARLRRFDARKIWRRADLHLGVRPQEIMKMIESPPSSKKPAHADPTLQMAAGQAHAMPCDCRSAPGAGSDRAPSLRFRGIRQHDSRPAGSMYPARRRAAAFRMAEPMSFSDGFARSVPGGHACRSRADHDAPYRWQPQAASLRRTNQHRPDLQARPSRRPPRLILRQSRPARHLEQIYMSHRHPPATAGADFASSTSRKSRRPRPARRSAPGPAGTRAGGSLGRSRPAQAGAVRHAG